MLLSLKTRGSAQLGQRRPNTLQSSRVSANLCFTLGAPARPQAELLCRNNPVQCFNATGCPPSCVFLTVPAPATCKGLNRLPGPHCSQVPTVQLLTVPMCPLTLAWRNLPTQH